jgi:DNA adenine methylase
VIVLAQVALFADLPKLTVEPFTEQLLKWIGNKQRFAHEIVSFFPERFGRYFEPFLGSGAVLGTLAPHEGIASDVFQPLVDIWQTLRRDPALLVSWYTERWERMRARTKEAVFEEIKASYNASPNGADLLFLCRSCYGGVVRFRQADGYMSTPCGVHKPMPPKKFAQRVEIWHDRTRGTTFLKLDYREAFGMARRGDVVYCDPPYSHSQAILYGAQRFSLEELIETIAEAKARGVHVLLSIDGTKKTGNTVCHLPIRSGVFEQEALVNCGRSMLKRFQMEGQSLEGEVVHDRLLLTFS